MILTITPKNALQCLDSVVVCCRVDIQSRTSAQLGDRNFWNSSNPPMLLEEKTFMYGQRPRAPPQRILRDMFFSRWFRNHLHFAVQPVVHAYREDFPQYELKVYQAGSAHPRGLYSERRRAERSHRRRVRRVRQATRGLRGWEFCPFPPIFANFSTFTKIPQVPSFQAHSPVKTVFRQNPKNARKSQNTPSTNPYQNETQISSSSLKNATSGHARPPKKCTLPSRENCSLPKHTPYQNETQFPLSSLKNANFWKARPPKSELCGERSSDTGPRV
mmetsp:Transcript_7443/g.27996  ORF Transcript_7443/g.27996 Transcript_7443/m.27996 type:complete len:274 (+) Transcript_7443:293-1114(+)